MAKKLNPNTVETHAGAIRKQLTEIDALLEGVESGSANWITVSDLYEVRRLLSEAVSRISPL